MPTSTFFNLPPPKREKLLRAAVAEFSRQPYGEVSLSQVIQAAGIPRGSFYQYFDDKTDLFRYVLGCYGQRLEAVLQDCFTACGGRPLELPLALFDQVVERARSSGEEFRAAMEIVRQNAGLDMSQFDDAFGPKQDVVERLNLSGLALDGPEEVETLMEMLWECTVHALAFVCCGKLTAEESRKRLSCKIALIRRGVELVAFEQGMSCNPGNPPVTAYGGASPL